MPSNRRIRKRVLPPRIAVSATVVNEDFSVAYNQVRVNAYGPSVHEGNQITDSEGHAWPRPKSVPFSDEGGDFYTMKRYLRPGAMPFATLEYLHSSVPLVRNTYRGHVFPITPGFATYPGELFPPAAPLSDAELDSKGTTAIKRCKPGDPHAQFSTAFGELLKDGLPAIPGVSLLKDRVSSLLGRGSGEYLNYQFGVAPLLSDLDKLKDVVTKSGSLIEQFERDAGRHVRRGYAFPIERSAETVDVITNVYPGWINAMDARSPVKQALLGKTVRRREVFRRIWFSGSFTYSLPPDWNSANSVKSTAAKFKQLAGTELTAETLYNLTPWSWAIDWFSSTGDVLSNMNSFMTNGLVMHYGYVMCHTIVTDTYSHVLNQTSSLDLPRVPELVCVTETKQRRKANPFGFGVSWDGLTPFQVSIAAALGISRKS